MSETNDISSAKQDGKWPAMRLVVVGAFALLAAIGVIYAASSILGEPLVR